MAITDLATLITTVSQWLGGSSDTNFEDNIRTGVQLTEAELNRGFVAVDGRPVRGLRVPEMIEISTADYDEKYELLPPGFLEMRAVYRLNDAGQESPLGAVTEERAGHYDRLRAGACGGRYVVTNGMIRLSPRPAETVTLRLVYYAEVPELLNGGAVTVLRGYPQVYLHGTLAHMAGYLIDDPRIPQWRAMFAAAVVNANLTSGRRSGSYAA